MHLGEFPFVQKLHEPHGAPCSETILSPFFQSICHL